VVIETDFAHRPHLRMPQKCPQIPERVRIGFFGVVRMNANGGVNERIYFRETNSGFQIGRPVARADGEHVFQSGGPGPFDHIGPVSIELFVVQMTMRINEFHDDVYFNRAPTGMSS
jgi:hypothetical protein